VLLAAELADDRRQRRRPIVWSSDASSITSNSAPKITRTRE
jgi:hypothetical protein